MKKLVTIVITLALVLSMAMPVLAKPGVSLRKVSDDWYLDVINDYEGEVEYKDNKNIYKKVVNGNGEYRLGLQRDFKGQLTLVKEYGEDVDDEKPYIIGTRTITTTTFDGYTKNYSFLANQKNQKGPKANYINATITESYTIDTKVYDVWSNEEETLNEEASSNVIVPVVISGKSDPLPNGSETNYPASFTDGLGGYSVYVTYKGNGNKFSCTETAPVRETVKTDVYDYFE